MKRFSPVYVTILFLAFACTNAPDADKAKTSDAKEVSNSEGDSWKVDTSASEIEWVATKVSGYHTGTVNLKSGELLVKDGKPTGGSFVMDMTSIIVSGPKGSDAKSNEKLLGHLKSPDFFEVNAHPIASFVITSITPFSGAVKDTTDPRQETISKYKVANPTHTVSGNLTIKGVTKNIEFPASIVVATNTANAIAKFNIDRTQWNIVYPGKPDDLIRNDIHLGISLKAGK
ncbi:MAG: YceI family protein [Chitinophagaceae bacterium]|nr:MAG: YceI family protein [Chitinophagaceae bacterium]